MRITALGVIAIAAVVFIVIVVIQEERNNKRNADDLNQEFPEA